MWPDKDSCVDGSIGGKTDALHPGFPGIADDADADAVAAAPASQATVACAAPAANRPGSLQGRPNPHPLPSRFAAWDVHLPNQVGSVATSAGYLTPARSGPLRQLAEENPGLPSCASPDTQCSTAAVAHQRSERICLPPPVRWKSTQLAVRHHAPGGSDLRLAPASWSRANALSAQKPAPAWWQLAMRELVEPLSDPLRRRWLAGMVALRHLAQARLAQAARFARARWSQLPRHGVALAWLCGVLAVAAVSIGWGLRYRFPAMQVAAVPVTVSMRPLANERPVPEAAIAAAQPATSRSAATAVAAHRSVDLPAAKNTGAFVSDASTMDLMMRIAEPDLDITSRHSLWAQIGKSSGIDPLLLYSVALVETKALYPDGRIAPTPWLFRVNDHLVRGSRHHVQLQMAAASQFGSDVQDVGIMQVYYPMHRDAVRDPLTLLNPRTNITVAAKILRKGMHQTHDRVLGVGYYHSHTPALARDYGTAVLTVYRRLKGIYRPKGSEPIVAR